MNKHRLENGLKIAEIQSDKSPQTTVVVYSGRTKIDISKRETKVVRPGWFGAIVDAT